MASVLIAVVMIVVVVGRPAPAAAQDAAARIANLNKSALDAFDNLNFDQAKTLLQQALADAQTAGLGRDLVTARTHLNMGMLLIAGFQERNEAIEHFNTALTIRPDVMPAAGLFNPEVQAVFDQVKASFKPPAAPPRVAEQPRRPAHPPAAAPHPKRVVKGSAGVDGAPSVEEEEEEEDDEARADAKVFLSIGLGSGFGLAKGHLDANKDSVVDNQWSGGLAPSRLGHILVAGGYFIAPRLLLALEGRIQVVSGTTIVKGMPGTTVCAPSCSAPSTGIAVLAKASWFFSAAPLRPFVSGGIGAGAIRQVVKINVVQSPGQPTTNTGCGNSGTETCVDTVTGGPLFLAAGGGVAYEIGSLTFLGSVTANVGVPNVMLNIDALLGVGMRL